MNPQIKNILRWLMWLGVVWGAYLFSLNYLLIFSSLYSFIEIYSVPFIVPLDFIREGYLQGMGVAAMGLVGGAWFVFIIITGFFAIYKLGTVWWYDDWKHPKYNLFKHYVVSVTWGYTIMYFLFVLNLLMLPY